MYFITSRVNCFILFPGLAFTVSLKVILSLSLYYYYYNCYPSSYRSCT